MSRRSLTSARTTLMGLLWIALPLWGCSGSDGAPGASTGTLMGTVTNSANQGAPVADATIKTNPVVPNVTIKTNANGQYSTKLPVGTYSLTVTATNFQSVDTSASVLAAVTQTMDFALDPVSNVMMEVSGMPAAAAPGESFGLAMTVTPMDGSTVQSYSWSQSGSATATIADETTANPTVTLADTSAYKQALLDHLNVQDRFAILGVDPHAFELGTSVTLHCDVTTTSGSYAHEVDVPAAVPFAAWSTSLRNVPTKVPVLLEGKDQASYDWVLGRPVNSTATLMDATTRFPWFVPDVPGTYTLTVTDLAASMPFQLPVYAAEWEGAIVGQDAEGRPTTICATACHSLIFPEKFDQWAHTGHAEIFTQNIDTGGHYGPDCFACHTVGYNTSAANKGFDDTTNFQGFLDAMFPNGVSHPDPDNWTTVIAQWPDQARKANIQCESCHGPNGIGGAHANMSAGDARISVSAEVCGSCHGEPPRHARYQQWQESGHGNFATAIAEGTNGSCAKCHTAQGFLEWFANGCDPSFHGTAVPEGEIQPITCVVCHDPHDVGTVSGETNNAHMRLEGDSPPLLGGFTAYGMGKGAMCIVCHNTRRGEANDVITSTPDRAPHGGAQGDVLMGENAFFVTSGVRGPHSLITNTCTTCHIKLTPPPADLSYQLGGTNHTFEANTSICSDCHGLFDANSLMALTQSRLAALQVEIQTAIEKEIRFHTDNGRSVRITGDVGGTATTIDITGTSVINSIELLDSHGRSAMNIDVDGVVYGGVQLNGGTQIIAGGSPDGRLLSNSYSNAEDILAKSCWNFFVMHNDSSSGIHNPGWVTEIIAATSAQLSTNWP